MDTSMESAIQELREIIKHFTAAIAKLEEPGFSTRPSPEKWSQKEVLGHLVDSAQNNLRRFICGQYEASPPKILYDQDFWVASNHYRQMDKHDVIQLWRLLNERIAAVLENMPAENASKLCDVGKLQPISWLAEDYIQHMKHHLNQIIPGSFDIVYIST